MQASANESKFTSANIFHITEWDNNCAASLQGWHYLTLFIKNKLSKNQERMLCDHFSKTYVLNTVLTSEQLKTLLLKHFPTPIHWQLLGGVMVKDLLMTDARASAADAKGGEKTIYPDGTMTTKAFEFLASALNYNVEFLEESGNTLKSANYSLDDIAGASPQKGNIQQDTLYVIYQQPTQQARAGHYNVLLQDPNEAKKLNELNYQVVQPAMPKAATLPDQKREFGRLVQQELLKMQQQPQVHEQKIPGLESMQGEVTFELESKKIFANPESCKQKASETAQLLPAGQGMRWYFFEKSKQFGLISVEKQIRLDGIYAKELQAEYDKQVKPKR